MKQIYLRLAIGMALFVCLFTGVSCNKDKRGNNPRIEGVITSYNDFGAAMFDFTEADMSKAGFRLGDDISISLDDAVYEMPYYDGFYTRNGEFLCVAYPTYPSICFTANNTGLPESLTDLEGHSVVLKLKKKRGSINVQKALSMKYTNVREDYSTISDAAFANARAVRAGQIAVGKLHRSSSPFSNEIGRASYVSEYIHDQGIQAVLNLTDTEDKMYTYVMPAYSKGLWDNDKVILCPLKADPTAEEYNDKLIAALKELPSYPTPYLVHCTEGKDCTGYVCALLEGLCGATYDEIVADYLITYDNYYKKTPAKDGKVCDALVSLRLNTCLMHYADVSDESLLPQINFAQSFSSYLTSHGMSRDQVEALIQALK